MKTLFTILLLISSLAVRAQFISVPNHSFETPATDLASPVMDDWQKTPPSPYWDTNNGPWEQNMGEFANPPQGQIGNLINCDGVQAAYIVSFPGCGVLQSLPATFRPGRSYAMTVGLTTSTYDALTEGTTLQLSIYYLSNSVNPVTIASTNVVFSTNIFTNIDYFSDFSVSVPEVNAGDAWAGQNIGLSIVSTATFSNLGGVWDADNVRLTAGPSLTAPSAANGKFSITVSSYPGLAFKVLGSSDVTQPLASWTTVGTLTNFTGTTNLTLDAGASQQFFSLKQLP